MSKISLLFVLMATIITPAFMVPSNKIILVLSMDSLNDVTSENNIMTSVTEIDASNSNDFYGFNTFPDAVTLKVEDNRRYTAGQRVPGDRLIGTKKDYHSYTTPQNIKLELTVPKLSAGRLTFIEVDVQQSSTQGRAYITDGGIGQDHIKLVVEAPATTYFGYTALVYAK